jgi:hypothetical protein
MPTFGGTFSAFSVSNHRPAYRLAHASKYDSHGSSPSQLTDASSFGGAAKVYRDASRVFDPPPLKWSDLRYVFDIKEDCNVKEAIQA